MGDGALGLEGGDPMRSTSWNNFSNPLTSALLPSLCFSFPHFSALNNLKGTEIFENINTNSRPRYIYKPIYYA